MALQFQALPLRATIWVILELLALLLGAETTVRFMIVLLSAVAIVMSWTEFDNVLGGNQRTGLLQANPEESMEVYIHSGDDANTQRISAWYSDLNGWRANHTIALYAVAAWLRWQIKKSIDPKIVW